MRTKGCLLCSNSSDLLNVALRTTISSFLLKKNEKEGLVARALGEEENWKNF